MEREKNTLVYIFLAFIVLVAVVNLTFTVNSKDSLDFLKSKSETLEKEISLIREENKKLESEVEQYKKVLVTIDSMIGVNNSKIDKIKIKGDEKINSFKSFSALEWERYFTERYERQRAKGQR